MLKVLNQRQFFHDQEYTIIVTAVIVGRAAI